MSAVPFRLRPCADAAAAEADALTFGDPALFNRLSTLSRVEIQAESPRVRAGTIWCRLDNQFCFVEAVAIRSGMYPLVYKVLPEMLAAQLGFLFVGRYFNMTPGYGTRSLVWDEKLIAENGARSFASLYPAMVPIVKLTAIVGTNRTPILVRNDQDNAGAADDLALLGDDGLAEKLADISRLEVVSGSDGTRAGTIWYFRNGNYCFVIAMALRPAAPAEAAKLAPLLAAQFFGYSFVGNRSGIPADLKDKALCWDRHTGSPIPELPALSGRLSGEQDFVVTFADSAPPGNPMPDPDPFPYDLCESPEDHRWQSGWSYDGCHWSYQESPGSDYNWQDANGDGLGGSWNWTDPGSGGGDPPPPDPINNPETYRWQSGWSWDGSTWTENPYPNDGYSYEWISNGDGLGGSWNLV